MSTATPTHSDTRKALNKAAPVADYLDRRTGVGKVVREFARKVFPDHWSFMLGEIALYSFIVLVLSGFFLTMYFVPSMGHVTYPEDQLPVTMQGVGMSEAFASTLRLSFEVRGGLLMRQIHHWAALLFVAAIVAHMLRVFFTGAFRKPRELNWVIGFTLLILALLAGFSGYSLPDDVLSGNGLRIADGVARSIPIIGSYVSLALFGGEFPGVDIIPRLFTVHILLVPALIVALVTIHLVLVVVHKHTQYPGPGRTEKNVVGYPVLPVYAAKAGGFFFVVFGFIALLGALVSINPVWIHGPYDPSPVGAGAQPDWYMLFLEGGLRLMPGWPEFVIGGYTLSLNILIPGVVIPGVLFTLLAVWPFVEAAVTKDRGEHHVLDRPRNAPVRTATGVAVITAFMVLNVAGANDILATHFELSLNGITWFLRIMFFVAPVFAFWITKRICLSLQRRDRELALHGHETGRIVRMPSGQYLEVHQPLDDDERWVLVSYDADRMVEIDPAEDENGVRRPGYEKDKQRQRLSRFFYEDRIEPVTPVELAEEMAAHGGHDGEETAIEEEGGLRAAFDRPEQDEPAAITSGRDERNTPASS
ncbi:cytochrome bc complex cytochrome b subunit [Georgenia wutianyii]|uniref:Cytochrome bc1 complex cytochrome b subunit n=1 Tax=Georgenia wutianyii TaxID=2585135 RepID=A0ABX5VNS4_9MICO|nr:cytochrome bc complex cytochrome b subunit [Georgenia wutianyii]QDB79476.1 cytochrome bc complex cytochrome b subunit [Georgenia wutianyii]